MAHTNQDGFKTAPLNNMLKCPNITKGRITNFYSSSMFKDLNLPNFVWKPLNVDIKMSVWAAPNLTRPTFNDAVKQAFSPIDLSYSFGPTFSTHWVKLEFTIKSEHLPSYLIFNPGCEALVWSKDGEPLQGLTGGTDMTTHIDFPLKSSGSLTYYIEVACNGLTGVDGITPPPSDKYYKFLICEIQKRNEDAQDLLWKYEILKDIVNEFSSDSQIYCEALYSANSIINSFRADYLDKSVADGLSIANAFFNKRKLPGDVGFDHKVIAIGNCHIDTAWLWTYDETKRKVARSWSTQCSYIEKFPQFKFTASQAQQFEWLKQLYPKLFDRVQKYIKTGNFIPIGGTWVEMDCNMPSGEGLVRQFLYGQHLYKEYFNKRCSTFWLPDTFGYSAQLPQIVSQVGIKNFFTQKLSWNNINKFPHSSFVWKGLDESTVVSHFSPADTYTAQASVKDIVFMVKNNKDKYYSNVSLLPYGNGDGGGGPLEHMIQRIDKLENVQGFNTKVEHGTVDDFYNILHKSKDILPVWKGELYFELHRGTYTTHGAVKRGNRKSEFLLRNIEIVNSLNFINQKNSSFQNPKSELDRLWKLVLLNQFHDCLPGSSIEVVYDDVLAFYEDVQKSGNKILNDSIIAAVTGDSKNNGDVPVFFNTLGWKRNELVELTKEQLKSILTNPEILNSKILPNFIQKTNNGINDFKPYKYDTVIATKQNVNDYDKDSYIVRIGLDAFAINEVVPIEQKSNLTYKVLENKSVLIENSLIKVKFDRFGRLLSLIEKSTGFESIKENYLANNFKLFDDQPLFWDAWDIEIYHLEKGWDVTDLGEIEIVEKGDLRIILQVQHKIPSSAGSYIKQRIIIEDNNDLLKFENEIEWQENRKALKVEFPTTLMCDYATYDVQFGTIRRPTHYNSSWDIARFEVCGHKFVDLSEHNFGLSLFTDCKYGYSVSDNVIRITLLRAPKAPDGHADMGKHYFSYGVYPHKNNFNINVVQKSYEFNLPLIKSSIKKDSVKTNDIIYSKPWIQVLNNDNNVSLQLDTIKVSEAGDSVVIRLYEPIGARGKANIATAFNIKEVIKTNLLEDSLNTDQTKYPSSVKPEKINFTTINNISPGSELHCSLLANKAINSFEVDFKPYEILTFKIKI